MVLKVVITDKQKLYKLNWPIPWKKSLLASIVMPEVIDMVLAPPVMEKVNQSNPAPFVEVEVSLAVADVLEMVSSPKRMSSI
jgi:hypothetical protein